MPKKLPPAPRPAKDLQPGRYFSEAELAEHAAYQMGLAGLTQTTMAERLSEEAAAPVPRQAVHAALRMDPDNPGELAYPTRGHNIRRAILRALTGYDFSGPWTRAEKPGL